MVLLGFEIREKLGFIESDIKKRETETKLMVEKLDKGMKTIEALGKNMNASSNGKGSKYKINERLKNIKNDDPDISHLAQELHDLQVKVDQNLLSKKQKVHMKTKYKYRLFDGILQRKIEKMEHEILKINDVLIPLQNKGRNFKIGTYVNNQTHDSRISFDEFKSKLDENKIRSKFKGQSIQALDSVDQSSESNSPTNSMAINNYLNTNCFKIDIGKKHKKKTSNITDAVPVLMSPKHSFVNTPKAFVNTLKRNSVVVSDIKMLSNRSRALNNNVTKVEFEELPSMNTFSRNSRFN